jgi:hypothetical protein
MESNQKMVNAIYIRQLAFEQDSMNTEGLRYEYDSAETYQLEFVAYQNPALGGDAVYMARAMLMIDVEDFNTRSPQENNNKDSSMFELFKIYPNPNNGKMQLNYNLNDTENGFVNIYNIMGAKIRTYKLLNGEKMLTIDESKLQGGIYYYQVYINDIVVYSDKIIIAK